MANGWISQRAMRGNRIGGKASPEKNKQPLRKIEYVEHYSESMFEPNYVKLECGHMAHAWGLYRARCPKCQAGKPPDTKLYQS